MVSAGAAPAAPANAASNDAEQRRGALVDEIVFTQERDPGKAVGLIERGTQQVFAQSLTNTTVYRRLRDSSALGYELAYGGSAELTLNPAGPELAGGRLNPFHEPRIREALNWLIDRRYIAEEIYGGLAVPRFLPINTAFPDYARLAVTARALEREYAYDPQRAEGIINREMRALGASLEAGRWIYDGKPVRLIVLIRTEDARKRVGDYVANRLEAVGFTVRRRYRTAAEAAPLWLASDPQAGRWHVYTGGWVATVINRDVSENLSFYYTARGRPEPLWQAYEPSPAFDRIADRLQRRDYASRAERRELMRRGLRLAMKDSARVWLVDQLGVAPRSADVALAADLAGGIAGSRLWPYTLRFRDRVGGRMVIGVPSLLTEPWNPLAGSNWLFDRMITRALGDAPVLPDPFTGLYRPQRIASATVTVAGEVPVSRTLDWLRLERAREIPVPGDAWIGWNADAQRLVTVAQKHPEGITARTRTRIVYARGYLQRRWHDGSPMSLADVVLPFILTFARANADSALFDPSAVPDFEVFQRHFRGWRIVSRQPLVIEVYSDQIYPDAESIVAARAPDIQPWHTLALGIRAERGGSAAFSSHKADRRQIPWLSLVAGPSLEVLDRMLRRARKNGFLPYARVLGAWTRRGEIAERYAALTRWRREHGHFWVGDGPFYLDAVYPIEQAVVLRRFDGFPDRADKWLGFDEPPIPELELTGPMMAQWDHEAVFDLQITFQGEPYPAAAIAGVQYLLFDAAGELAARGDAEATGPGHWRVRLPAERLAALGAGANSLEVAVTSRRVALPAFASHAFASVPPGTAMLGPAP